MVGLAWWVISVAQQQYQVDVKVKGIKKGKAFLKYWGEKGPFLDSVGFNNGQFTFKGKVPVNVAIARIYILEPNERNPKIENSCEVWLETGRINIVAGKYLANGVHSGSELQKQFSELQQNLLPVKRKSYELDDAYEKAEAAKDAVKKDKLLDEEYPALFKEKQKILGAFIQKYPSSLVSAFKFDEFAGDVDMDIAVVEPVYKILDNKIKQHPRVIKVAERIVINKRTAPGMNAIEFTQADTSGKPVSLASFSGKYVLVDFWAGWCMPCRAENPNLIKMYDRYRGQGFEILGVSLDGERKRWTGAIVTDKVSWQQVSDLQIFDNAVAKQYGITSIPQNILIGPDGKIIAKNLRGSRLENKLSEIFKK